MEKNIKEIFEREVMGNLFPKERADQFFDALFGDPDEGAFNISLQFKGYDRNKLLFEFHLSQRPNKCLACNLTAGLPEVFSRHPVINVKGVIREIDRLLDDRGKCADWKLGRTQEVSDECHVIPLVIFFEN